jgi:hypothetical protein
MIPADGFCTLLLSGGFTTHQKGSSFLLGPHSHFVIAAASNRPSRRESGAPQMLRSRKPLRGRVFADGGRDAYCPASTNFRNGPELQEGSRGRAPAG